MTIAQPTRRRCWCRCTSRRDAESFTTCFPPWTSALQLFQYRMDCQRSPFTPLFLFHSRLYRQFSMVTSVSRVLLKVLKIVRNVSDPISNTWPGAESRYSHPPLGAHFNIFNFVPTMNISKVIALVPTSVRGDGQK